MSRTQAPGSRFRKFGGIELIRCIRYNYRDGKTAVYLGKNNRTFKKMEVKYD